MRATVLGVAAGLAVSAALLVAFLTLVPGDGGRGGTAAGETAAPSRSAPGSPATPSSAPAAESPSPPVGLRLGDRAPPLSLAQLGGGRVDLAKLRGKPVWVNFMATWCPPCRDELPLMERYQTQLGDAMTIVLVDVKESTDTVASFATELRLTLPIGLDSNGRAQRDWGAYALPVHYWLDTDGRIRAFAFGGIGPDQFREGVRKVLPNADLRP